MSDRLQVFFDGLGARFRPEAAAGLDAVFLFDITGAGGGVWHAIVADSTCVIARGTHPAPSVTIRASGDDVLAMADRTLNPQVAFMTGKLALAGDMGLALRLQQIFFA